MNYQMFSNLLPIIIEIYNTVHALQNKIDLID